MTINCQGKEDKDVRDECGGKVGRLLVRRLKQGRD